MNYYFNKIFVLSPLIRAYENRDVVFDLQAKHFNLKYQRHTGINHYNLISNYDFKHKDIMKNSIHSNESNTWSSRETAASVTQGHLDIVHYAAESNFQNVLIFENDVLFKDNTKAIFDKLILHLPEDWDILYLGGLYNYQDEDVIYKSTVGGDNVQLSKLKHDSVCAHAYALSEKAIKRFNGDFNDLVSQGKFFIIDQFLGYCTKYLGYNTYAMLPKLTEQGDLLTPYLSGNENLDVQDLDISKITVRESYFETNKYFPEVNKQMYLNLIQKHLNDKGYNTVTKIMDDVKKKMMASDDIYDKRMAICRACKFYDEGLCERCGCDMVKKNKLISAKCPIKKF